MGVSDLPLHNVRDAACRGRIAEHPDLQLGEYVLAGWSRKQLAGFIDMAAYLEQRHRVEGIEDLQPPSAPGADDSTLYDRTTILGNEDGGSTDAQ